MTDYCYPASVEEAVAYLEGCNGQACVIAGGTDMLPDLQEGKVAALCLVDITRIPALQRIEVDDATVTMGAAVTFAALREHAFLRQHVHALVEAAGSVGAEAIQNAATWGGNIVQAMPAADGAIVALALDAEAEIVSCGGARWEPVEALFEGPGCSVVDSRREIVTRLRFPRPRAGTGTAWRRVGRRAALVLPILNCAVRVKLEQVQRDPEVRGTEPGPDDAKEVSVLAGDVVGASALDTRERIAEVAIALGPVAPRPYRARKAEAFLKGRAPRTDVLEHAGEIARGEANPRSSVMRASREYRLGILPTLVSEALATAVERARGQA
jgi:carbon-monoxide dehydrogenase medium subunit